MINVFFSRYPYVQIFCRSGVGTRDKIDQLIGKSGKDAQHQGELLIQAEVTLFSHVKKIEDY